MTLSEHSYLPLAIAVPTIIVTLLWLAHLNHKNFRAGWPLWRRNLLGLAGAVVFIIIANVAIYHRAWEIFEPAEPSHGPAKLSLANPPVIHHADNDHDLLVQLPDGRVWLDRIGLPHDVIHAAVNPFPTSVGLQQFLVGSNWVNVVLRHFVYYPDGHPVFVYLETVGIQTDGTLWVSDISDSQLGTRYKLAKFGEETNWQALGVSRQGSSVLLLKKDGTLWRWGTNQWNWHKSSTIWPVLRSFNPYRVGTNSDWKRISYSGDFPHLQKADGSSWSVSVDPKSGQDMISRSTIWDQVDLEKLPQSWPSWLSLCAFVRKDGTWWTSMFDGLNHGPNPVTMETIQNGQDTNWVSVAMSWMGAVALKSDATLWQSGFDNQKDWSWHHPPPPIRLGIHNDWVAIASVQNDVLALAADGSLWLWPFEEKLYRNPPPLIKPSKQPQWLGNVFSHAD